MSAARAAATSAEVVAAGRVAAAAVGKARLPAEHRLAVMVAVAESAAGAAVEACDTELAVWRAVWRTPQATQWERLGWTREVAQYVRHKVRAEQGSINDAKEARQLSDRLGLSPLALLRLRWEVVDDTTSGARPGSPGGSGRYSDLKVVS